MSLTARDALLSRLCGVPWPAAPLLEALGPLSPPALDAPNALDALDVLDLGAGDGGLLRALRQRGQVGQLVGLDPEPGAGIRQGVAEALPFPDDHFDLVTLVRVVAHLNDVQAALHEAIRVLRPGGRLVLASHGSAHLRALRIACGHPASTAGPEKALEDALRDAGLNFQRADVHQGVTLSAADALALAQWSRLDLALPLADALPDTLHLAVVVHTKEAARP